MSGAACRAWKYAGIGVAAAAWAMALVPVARAAETPQADERRVYALPPGPLGEALTAFGELSGRKLLVASDLVRSLATRGVTGSFTPDEALGRLLAGTGLTFRYANPTTITVERIGDGPGGAVTLDPIRVEGAGETATGPVDGYVATRSATGTKTDTPLLETPQTISIVTRDQMQAQGVRNVDQALRYAPGVVTENLGVDNRFDSIYLRGFSADEYLDGLKFLSGSFAVPQLDPYGLERVEVLKGPASVLYGQASPGGLVNLVSKRPTATPFREVHVQFGSYDRKQGGFDIGGPIDEKGEFLYRVTGLAYETGTQVDFTEYQRYFIAPALTWKPTGNTTLTLLARHQEDPKAGFFNKLPAIGTALDNPNGQVPTDFYAGEPGVDKFDRSLTTVGYEFEHRFDSVWTVRQNLRYLDMDVDFATVFPAAVFQADQHTLNRFFFTSDEDLGVFTIDNQAQASFDTWRLKHRFLTGVDYQHVTWDQVARDGSAPAIDFLNPVYGQSVAEPPVFLDQRQKQDQVGVYAQDQVKLGNLSLLLGGRHDWAKSALANHLASSRSERHDTAFTGRAGVVYVFDAGLAPYFSYAESFQPTSGTSFSGTAFEPTSGQQLEVGLRYQPKALNALISVSAFDLTQQNVLTTDPDHANFNVQTGEIRSRGVELEAKASLTEGLGLTAAYSYLDAEVTEANDASEGNRPVGIPTHLASLWLDYRFQGGWLAGLQIGGGMRYRGASYGNTTNSFKIPDVALFDAAVFYDLGAIDQSLDGLQLAINASNLFDEEYVGRCQNNGCYYGLRRNVIGTITYRW